MNFKIKFGVSGDRKTAKGMKERFEKFHKLDW